MCSPVGVGISVGHADVGDALADADVGAELADVLASSDAEDPHPDTATVIPAAMSIQAVAVTDVDAMTSSPFSPASVLR